MAFFNNLHHERTKFPCGGWNINLKVVFLYGRNRVTFALKKIYIYIKFTFKLIKLIYIKENTDLKIQFWIWAICTILLPIMYENKKFHLIILYNIGFNGFFCRIKKLNYRYGWLNDLSEGARDLFINLRICLKTCPKIRCKNQN